MLATSNLSMATQFQLSEKSSDNEKLLYQQWAKLASAANEISPTLSSFYRNQMLANQKYSYDFGERMASKICPYCGVQRIVENHRTRIIRKVAQRNSIQRLNKKVEEMKPLKKWKKRLAALSQNQCNYLRIKCLICGKQHQQKLANITAPVFSNNSRLVRTQVKSNSIPVITPARKNRFEICENKTPSTRKPREFGQSKAKKDKLNSTFDKSSIANLRRMLQSGNQVKQKLFHFLESVA